MRVALITTVLACIALSATAELSNLWTGNTDANNDGDWSDDSNWEFMAPQEGDIAVLPAVTGNGSSGNSTRTITVNSEQTVGEVQVPGSSGSFTNLIKVAADLTVGKITGGWLDTEVAPAATLTLGNDLNSMVPLLTGSGQFVKVGTGTATQGWWTQFGAAWTGTIDVQEGMLSVAEGGWTHTSMLTVHDGAMFDQLTVKARMGQAITLHGEGIDGQGALRFSGGGSGGGTFTDASLTIASDSTINISNAAGILTFTAPVSGSGILTKIGDGKLVLGTGWLGGVEIAEGTLQIGGKLTSDIHIAAGATLIAGEGQIIGTVTGDGTWDKTVAASWIGPAGNPNDDGVWHVPSHWSAGVLPSVATLPDASGRTITIAEGNPITIDQLIVPGAGGVLQVLSEFTVGRCSGKNFTVNIAEDALFTLGSDQASDLPRLTGSGQFVKVGTGTATQGWWTQFGAAWTGTIDVQEGMLSVAEGGWTHTSMLTVHDGAMFDQLTVKARMGQAITLHGEGIDGQGALRFSGGGSGGGTFTDASLTIASDSTINISNAAGVLTFTGDISGPGLLTKTGPGTLALAGTCATDVAVARGTLVIEDDLIDDDKVLRVSLGAKLDIADFADEHVAQLFFGREPQEKGSWGKTDSGADHINDVYFAGRTGIVTVDTSLTLDGDVNGDCVVNILDLIGIRNHLNQDPNSPLENQAYNVNGDDAINILDMIYVRNRLNTKCEE